MKKTKKTVVSKIKEEIKAPDPYITTNAMEAEELSKKGFIISAVLSPDEGKGIKERTFVFKQTKKEIYG